MLILQSQNAFELDKTIILSNSKVIKHNINIQMYIVNLQFVNPGKILAFSPFPGKLKSLLSWTLKTWDCMEI